MPFRPSETLKAIADYAFIICGTIFMIVSAVLLWECKGLPCQPNQEWISHTFAIMCIATVASWLFRTRIVWYDLDAKVEDGIIKLPERKKRERAGYYASITKALETYNEGAKLNAWYLTGYAAAHVLAVFIRLTGASDWLWIPAILCFGIPEIHGLRTKKNTLSQTVWVFGCTGSRARRYAICGWIFWVTFVLWDMPPTIPDLPRIYNIPIAELCLVAGLIMWLTVGAFLAVRKATTWKGPFT